MAKENKLEKKTFKENFKTNLTTLIPLGCFSEKLMKRWKSKNELVEISREGVNILFTAILIPTICAYLKASSDYKTFDYKEWKEIKEQKYVENQKLIQEETIKNSYEMFKKYNLNNSRLDSTKFLNVYKDIKEIK